MYKLKIKTVTNIQFTLLEIYSICQKLPKFPSTSHTPCNLSTLVLHLATAFN